MCAYIMGSLISQCTHTLWQKKQLILKLTVVPLNLYPNKHILFTEVSFIIRGPGSVVGIATTYGLDGPEIESRWGEIFRTSPDRP